MSENTNVEVLDAEADIDLNEDELNDLLAQLFGPEPSIHPKVVDRFYGLAPEVNDRMDSLDFQANEGDVRDVSITLSSVEARWVLQAIGAFVVGQGSCGHDEDITNHVLNVAERLLDATES